ARRCGAAARGPPRASTRSIWATRPRTPRPTPSGLRRARSARRTSRAPSSSRAGNRASCASPRARWPTSPRSCSRAPRSSSRGSAARTARTRRACRRRCAPHDPTSCATCPARAPRSPSSATRPAERASRPAELVELRVVDPEEVRDLVRDGDRDLLDDVLARVADRERRVAEDEDAVRKLTAAPVTALGEGDPVVVPEQGRVLGRGVVLDEHDDVLELARELLGHRVERVAHRLLELLAG